MTDALPNDLDLVGGSLPAFPFLMPSGQIEPGLTKRELFAAMAMQGFLTNCDGFDESNAKHLADSSVIAADALLAALEQNRG